MEQFQLIFELIGTVAFAISGAMLGIRKGLDLFGVSMTGMLTTIGGGILRDTILGRTPPAALTDPLEALMAIGVSMLVFLICARLHPHGEHRYADLLLLVADSIGLGVFTANGAAICTGSVSFHETALLCMRFTRRRMAVFSSSSEVKSLEENSSEYASLLPTSTLPLRSVMIPREASTVSVWALLEMDFARFSLPWTICASDSVTTAVSRNSPKNSSRIRSRRTREFWLFKRVPPF